MTLSPATTGTNVSTFEENESEVRLYCRKFPVVFERADGAHLYAEDGRDYLDFFCGAGALNYGHNPPWIIDDLRAYLDEGGILHGLDMYTVAKRRFIEAFRETVLIPRGLRYKLQFCGPTGTDAVEAALKLARRATGRRTVVSFGGAFHGMSRGSLGVTGSRRARTAGGISANEVVFVPYEDGPAGSFDSIGYLRRLFADSSSGVEPPAAVIVEAIQVEGGIYPASEGWLRGLQELTRTYGALLICDEIQIGCGRTGDFFGFEAAGLEPDVVTLSKSIGGAGLPLSLALIRPDLDVWNAGEHTGTFRGNQLAFVAGAAALSVWRGDAFPAAVAESGRLLAALGARLQAADAALRVRGRGMLLGIDLGRSGGPERAAAIQQRCFADGLVLELCGRDDEVVKVMPPLTIAASDLERGLAVLETAVRTT
ncbi:diaminobutyrate--2-oxoglutarate transaminase [Mangrovihabitans endophyticus]|uniref:Diaminobutyrate--2-oxoglutarate transaminase n=1 Tax=Mangrovihabitans endophyticus TaxID=1751298 RepID=A0A8J3FLP6_9ACTN|nr:diaminobutyrate--2-oxoglutarate transaminase [Mangrovihabitans endophyticus]GGK73840.1 putative aminotransferase y4qG [Mangrovihabitans endophyticus]